MNKPYFVGFLNVSTLALTSFNGGLHWFSAIDEARHFYANPSQAMGAHNVIVLGERLDTSMPRDRIIECKCVPEN